MNELFLKMTGAFAVMALALTMATALLVVHVSFAIAKCRRSVDTRYRAFMKKWLLRHALPSALVLTLLVLLLATAPAAFLGWYRTRSIHHLSRQNLVLRVHDQKEIPIDDGGHGLVYVVSHTTTNSAEIAELLSAA